MKKLILSFLALALVSSMAMAATSDYYSTNVGSKTGRFVKTQTPLTEYVILNANATKPTSSEVNAGEIYLSFLGSVTGEAQLYLISKDLYGNVLYRTIELGKASTNDAIVAQ
ncbi:MAG: hypothetical protein KKG92_15460 [Gammaproteobacteria bacterium]|nr:hypothetical protein [Gammaproteobacteria bacterium]